MLTRRELLAAGLAAPLWGSLLAGCTPRRARRPNLLFVHTDQLRADALSAYGNPHLQTPHLDELVRRGTSFLASYAASPVCVPARATWYTGRLPREHGALDNNAAFTQEFPDLGRWLDDAGYRCVYIGKWHVPRPPELSFRHVHHGRGAGAAGDAAIAEAAMGFLLNYSGEAPFFLTVGFVQPHDICLWYEDHQGAAGEPPELLAGALPPLPRNAAPAAGEPARLARLRAWERPVVAGWSEAAWRHALWSYHRQIEMLDREIGRLLTALALSAHGGDTVLLFSSDHGEMAGSHGLILKDTFYEESERVPLVVWVPARDAAGRPEASHVVHGADVFPTLCDYARVEPPPGLPGHSLRPLVEGWRIEWPEFRVVESGSDGRMVRSGRHKYVRYSGDPTEMLFDLVADPGELRNLAGEAAMASVLEDHRRRLAEAEPGSAPAG